MPKALYLTTTLPYVNAEPHIGFALELVQADAVARAAHLRGQEIFFNTGTDEHGLKIKRTAEAAGLTPQAYVDQMAEKFRRLLPALGIWPEANFIRTTNPAHVTAAQEFWRRAAAAGDIYKKDYSLKYCVGCELEKTESELVDGHCPLHPKQEIELIAEENYFFRFSKYESPLLELYNSRPDLVLPESRLNEVKAFVGRGLQDFSISRSAAKQPWGIPVPDDPTQTMYVWFDALVNYVSAIGWGSDEEKFKNWWPVVQFAGKDNLRQQSAMWQAMLMSVCLPPSKQIIIHGFVTSGGQKMSKSLGNVIDPFALANDYGSEAVRYFLLRHVQPFEDTDVTPEKFKEAYNANLANGLGNLVSRVMKLASDHLPASPELQRGELAPAVVEERTLEDFKELNDHLTKFEFSRAMDEIWRHIGLHDAYIQETKPFSLIKTEPDKARQIIAKLVQGLADLAVCLEPFLPQTSATIKNLVKENKTPPQPLFPRK
ncbi:MAG: methionine--tRNA ligase [Patescibacteria group bacterium]